MAGGPAREEDEAGERVHQGGGCRSEPLAGPAGAGERVLRGEGAGQVRRRAARPGKKMKRGNGFSRGRRSEPLAGGPAREEGEAGERVQQGEGADLNQ